MQRFAFMSILLMLSGCVTAGPQVQRAPYYDNSEEEVQAAFDAVRSVLHDPYSARFEGYTAYGYGPEFVQYCGRVNGKNLVGAYVGSERFYVAMSHGRVVKGPLIDRPRHSSPASDICSELVINPAG